MSNKVHQGAVVHIAAEGGMGLKDRLAAARIHHKLPDDVPFYLIPSSIDLCSEDGDVDELIDEIDQIPNVVLIIIDTLSRALAGGDENSSTDMGALIRNCDRLKEETNAHVMLIHHSGKAQDRGARGHSSLRAAVDTEIEVKKGDGLEIIAEITKQRDGETGKKYGFLLTSIPLGIDEDGDLKSSCALTLNTEAARDKKKLSPQQEKAVAALKMALPQKGQMRKLPFGQDALCLSRADFKEVLKRAALTASDKPDNIRRVISQLTDKLVNDGIIGVSDDFVWLCG